MIAEQTVTCRYKIAGQETDIEIQMTVQLETPADPYADVSIEPRFEPIFPEELEDELYQRLRDGVNGGISLSGDALSPNSIAVRILDLRTLPSIQSIQDANDKANLGYLLEVTVSGIVETLLRSLENIRTGKEI